MLGFVILATESSKSRQWIPRNSRAKTAPTNDELQNHFLAVRTCCMTYIKVQVSGEVGRRVGGVVV